MTQQTHTQVYERRGGLDAHVDNYIDLPPPPLDNGLAAIKVAVAQAAPYLGTPVSACAGGPLMWRITPDISSGSLTTHRGGIPYLCPFVIDCRVVTVMLEGMEQGAYLDADRQKALGAAIEARVPAYRCVGRASLRGRSEERPACHILTFEVFPDGNVREAAYSSLDCHQAKAVMHMLAMTAADPAKRHAAKSLGRPDLPGRIDVGHPVAPQSSHQTRR